MKTLQDLEMDELEKELEAKAKKYNSLVNEIKALIEKLNSNNCGLGLHKISIKYVNERLTKIINKGGNNE